jgi:hypothetical protein
MSAPVAVPYSPDLTIAYSVSSQINLYVESSTLQIENPFASVTVAQVTTAHISLCFLTPFKITAGSKGLFASNNVNISVFVFEGYDNGENGTGT